MKTFKLLAMTGALSASLCLFAAAVPNITKQPENVRGMSGSSVEFSCEAEGENVSYTWCWYNESTGKNNAFAETAKDASPYIHGTKTNKLVIENMPAGYVGLKVSCYIKDSSNEAVWTENALIEEGLKITVQPSPVSASVGDTVTLLCETNAEDAVYTWCWYNESGKNWPMLKNTDDGKGFSLSGADASKLSIAGITEPYLGKTYACHISSESLGASLWSNPVIITKAETEDEEDETEDDKKEEDVKTEDGNEEEKKEEDAKVEDGNEEDKKEEDAGTEDGNEEDKKEEDAKVEDGSEEDKKEEDAKTGDKDDKDKKEEDVRFTEGSVVYESPDGKEHAVEEGEAAVFTVSKKYLDKTRYAYAWEYEQDGNENVGERNACTDSTLMIPYDELGKYLGGSFICYITDNADITDSYITEAFHLRGQPVIEQDEQTDIRFEDVPESAWYFESVQTACKAGLVNGMTEQTFDPTGKLTYAQAVKLAACLHQLCTDGDVTLTVSDSGAWYDSYTDYCIANGILSQQSEKGKLTASSIRQQPNDPISREEYVSLFSCALPDDMLEDINTVAADAIPDVKSDSGFAGAIYRFYRAGIIIGRDAKGTFDPHADITRAEISAILARVLEPGMRQTLPETFGK